MEELFSVEEVLSVLHGFNPWWSGKPYSVPEFTRFAFRAAGKLVDREDLRRAVLLSGPRRVGKTTVLKQLAHKRISDGFLPSSVLYLSLEHPVLKFLSLREILRLYHERLHPEGAPCLLLLDEVHNSEGWEVEVKLLVDHQANYRIVATGSATVVHRERLAESGVGRWVTVPVPTLSFFEFVHLRGEPVRRVDERLSFETLLELSSSDLTGLADGLRPLLPLFQRYLLVGGFPETATLDDLELCQRLLREDVVERVLKRDMTSLFGVRNVNDLERLFIYLCLHTGSILAHNTVATAMEVSKATVANHLELLEQANLIRCVPPVRLGGKSVLKARNKYFLVDAALRNAVLLRGEEIFSRPAEMGCIAETTVLRHLSSHFQGRQATIHYWREAASGLEVDFVVRGPGLTLPFEVKFRESASVEASGGLASFASSEGCGLAYLVTRSDRDFGHAAVKGMQTNFFKVPAHILCYLMGRDEGTGV